MQGWSPFRLSKGPLFSCQSSGKEAKMVPFSANKWSPFRLTNTLVYIRNNLPLNTLYMLTACVALTMGS